MAVLRVVGGHVAGQESSAAAVPLGNAKQTGDLRQALLMNKV